jgi:ABC-type sugar transport system substrate-binding protein
MRCEDSGTHCALALTVASRSASAETKKIALLVKNHGNGFFDAANKGAQEAAKELGDVEVIYTGPTQATPEGQIDIINSLVAQGVDAIAVSSNDADALVPALKKLWSATSLSSRLTQGQGRPPDESSRFGDGPNRQSMPQDGIGSS